MGEWCDTMLNEHVRLVKGVSYRKADLLPTTNTKLVNLACVTPGGGFRPDGLKNYAGEFREEQTLLPGDIAVALTDVTQTGAVVGRPIRIPDNSTVGTLVASLDIAKVVTTTNEVSTRWLYYRLQAPDYIGHVTGSTTGTTVRHLSPLDILRFVFPLPPLSEQRAIAEVLGALDDKIEANRREQDAAEKLVRSEVALAQMHSKTISPLGSLARRVSEICQRRDLAENTIYVGLEHMTRGSLLLNEWGSAGGLASAKAVFQPQDVLFGRLRPYFKKVAIAPSSGVCSTDILVLRAKAGDWAVVAAVLASDEVIDYASTGSEGTRMPRVSWDYLARYEVLLPDRDGRQALQRRTAPLLDLAMKLTVESRRLAVLRDALLPKLMSGELRVRQAESLVEAAL